MDETSPKPFVFVLMPFSSEFTDTYEVGIKPACRDAGAYCERVDEQIFLESILERVYNQIAKADIIIAEMTGRNPNVFYEVGYAHALNKIVILLTRNSDDIPFDLKHYPHIVYEGSITNLKSQLESRVNWYIKNPKKSQSTNEFSLKLYLNGELYREEMRVNAKCVDSNLFATIKLDFHNAGNRIFEEKCEIGIIIPEDFDIRYSTQHDIVNLPDKKNLCSLGSFHEILPKCMAVIYFSY